MPAAARRSAFLTHPVFRQAGFGRHHPLSISRHAAMLDVIEALRWLDDQERYPCPLADRDLLLRFHAADYVDAFMRVASEGVASAQDRERYNLGTMECPVFPGLRERALASVGGSVKAAELALAGAVAFHPGGGTHHGRPDRAAGFCYFNDPVFAILRLLDGGLSRVVYVDLDAHHGDGVELAFAGDPRVLTLSIHEEGRFPGTGLIDDRAGGSARNLPVPRGLNDSELDFLMTEAVLPLLERFAPEGLVVTAGADCLAGDPLSAMAISNVALWQAVDRLVAHVGVAVVLGGGGYNPWTVARGWAGLWATLAHKPMPETLPSGAHAVLEGLSCDLVDDEDRDAAWLSSIADAPNPGVIRGKIVEIARAVLA